MEMSVENQIKHCVYCDDATDLITLLNDGLDPNLGGGWPIRMAARHGSYTVVKTLIHFGANPHLLGESGASCLQLAVYSGAHWDSDRWSFLLSCCDSSQLADGAAVAIIFNNKPALMKILQTGRCNTNIPTTLTGKTLEVLAKSYKLHHMLNISVQAADVTSNASPRIARLSRSSPRTPRTLAPYSTSAHYTHRNLSPSVARFFHQTASQTALTPPHPSRLYTSPK